MSNRSLTLVVFQFSCFAFFIFTNGLIAGNYWVIFQIIGFILSVWGVLAMKLGNFNVQPEVKINAQFKSVGPYKYIRNPMYAGLILFFATSVILNYSYLRLSVLILLIIVFLEKIKLEEQFLSERFGEIYKVYKKKTSRLIPFIY